MGILQVSIFLGLVALFAHVIKGLTGFGPAIVFVSVGSLVYNPIDVIVLTALLDIIGGAYLTILNPKFLNNKEYWAPIGILMVIGAIIGAVTLFIFPPLLFEYLLGAAIIIISLWFILGDSEPNNKSEYNHKLGISDSTVGIFSGFCGGFTGMGGPPLIIYLGSKLEKDLFRAVIVRIFLMASIARFSSYSIMGMVSISEIWLYIIPPIGVIIGNYIGNHFFKHFEQRWFTFLMGLILLASGIRLIVS